MNGTTLALCQKPIIGVAMWLASMCVANQALKNAFVDLSGAGLVLDKEIDIPMDERYGLALSFTPSNDAPQGAKPKEFVLQVCNDVIDGQKEGSRAQRFTLEVELVPPKGRDPIHTQFAPTCAAQRGTNPNTLNLGYIDVKPGKYRMTIANRFPISLERPGKVKAIFYGIGAGFP